ncbi:MAG: hypothetical protein HYZ14_00870 [Bacteroidetes bacterium]|nr:hypothetical protein [Bacteroidota bacterium]
MKSFLSTLLAIFAFAAISSAQAPEMFNYQAVVRNTTGAVVQNQAVGVKITILQGSSSGPAVFSETHLPTTNNYGLINLQIGTGTNFGPQLNTIDWAADLYFMTVQFDPAGGSSYTITSTTQLISVPYALHAKTVEQNDDADADPTNEYNTGGTLSGTDLQLTDGGGTVTVDLSSLEDDADADPTNEIQTISKVGNIITLSNGGGAVTDDVNDADASPTNELNTGATLVGTTLNITDAGGTLAVNLSSLGNDADASTTNELNTSAALVGTTLNITDAGGTLAVNLSSLGNDADASTTNELNTSATLVGTTLNITDAGGTLAVNLSSLGNDADASTTNELNTSATLVGTTLNITDAGGTLAVNLSSLNDADGSTTNELNTSANLTGTTLNIIDAGGTLAVDLSALGDDADADPANEIQALSLVGTTLSISGGNSVTLGSGTDSQVLSIVGADLTISNGNTVTLPGGTDSQTLSIVGQDLTIAGGNTVTLPGGTDSQTLSIVGQNISIANGNTITIPADTDTDDQTLSIVGQNITIADGNTITIPADTDDQTLSIVGQNVTIAGGNTITIPDTDDQTLSLVGADLTIADGNTVTLPLQTHFIGEHFEGGIVVWVDSTGQHGLIAATADLAGTYVFEVTPNDLVVLATSLTDGQANTIALIAVVGQYTAAEACDTYAGGGFTDWYLPSAYELELLGMSNYVMGSSALTHSTYYWSSTQDATSAGFSTYRVRNVTFDISVTSELNALKVRPMREF